tara:strand:- start:1524 stop:2309 length:786 start_codon:yes stop_codon:yes gene_type:complete
VCVGNIYLGGTGKTQLVLKLNEILKKKYRTFVIKKKYKNQIDEQKLLSKSTNLILPNKRIDAIKKIEKSNKNIAIFDDGLQDKSIKYSMTIVCFSSVNSVGNGMILPAGPLREDLYNLKKYDIVFINGKKNPNLIKKIRKFNNKIKIYNGKYFLKNKKEFNLKAKYLAFCGIGTPENFFNLLQENKIKISKKLIFPDHFNYKTSDINKIRKLATKHSLKIVTTEKDFMKINKFRNFKVKFTDVDLSIQNNSNFKKFLLKSL